MKNFLKGSGLLPQEARLPLFLALYILRIIDITQTVIGLRLGLFERNEPVKSYGIQGLIAVNAIEILILVLTYLLANYLDSRYQGKLMVPSKTFSDYILLTFTVWSSYSTLLVNPLALSIP